MILKIILSIFLFQILYANASEPPLNIYPFIEWNIGSGRSYHNGYQSIGAFASLSSDSANDLFFLDLEIHRLKKGRIAGNYGLGWRTFFEEEIVGFNAFYDNRKLSRHTFHQLGLGVELISAYWDVRLNGYIPLGKKSFLDSIETIIFPEDGYSIQRERKQQAMWGMDIEIGKSFENIYFGLGPYFYKTNVNSSRDKTALGGLGRVSCFLWEVLKIDFSITYDNVFKTKSQVCFLLTFPLENCFPFRVVRNPILVSTKTCQYKF